jgi:hypothetical protein
MVINRLYSFDWRSSSPHCIYIKRIFIFVQWYLWYLISRIMFYNHIFLVTFLLSLTCSTKITIFTLYPTCLGYKHCQSSFLLNIIFGFVITHIAPFWDYLKDYLNIYSICSNFLYNKLIMHLETSYMYHSSKIKGISSPWYNN